MHSYGGLLKLSGSKLTRLISTFNAKNFLCMILGIFLVISAQFVLELCAAT